MDERRKKAFDFAQETSKQLITLATVIIGLTVTFGKDFAGSVQGCARFLAIGSWALFLLSILFGLMTLMAMTGSLEPKRDPNRPSGPPPVASIRGSNVTVPSIIQVVLFFLALMAAVWFGIIAGPGQGAAKPEKCDGANPATPTPSQSM